jgi:hypothetical protein
MQPSLINFWIAACATSQLIPQALAISSPVSQDRDFEQCQRTFWTPVAAGSSVPERKDIYYASLRVDPLASHPLPVTVIADL